MEPRPRQVGFAFRGQASALWLNLAAVTFSVALNQLVLPLYDIVVAAVVASEVLVLAGT